MIVATRDREAGPFLDRCSANGEGAVGERNDVRDRQHSYVFANESVSTTTRSRSRAQGQGQGRAQKRSKSSEGSGIRSVLLGSALPGLVRIGLLSPSHTLIPRSHAASEKLRPGCEPRFESSLQRRADYGGFRQSRMHACIEACTQTARHSPFSQMTTGNDAQLSGSLDARRQSRQQCIRLRAYSRASQSKRLPLFDHPHRCMCLSIGRWVTDGHGSGPAKERLPTMAGREVQNPPPDFA